MKRMLFVVDEVLKKGNATAKAGAALSMMQIDKMRQHHSRVVVDEKDEEQNGAGGWVEA